MTQLEIEQEFEKIRLEEEALNRKKLELMNQQRELARIAAMEKVISATIGLSLDNRHVTVKLSQYRQDVVNELTKIPGRQYNYQTSINTFPIAEYPTIHEVLSKLHNVTIELSELISTKIHAILYAPDYTVGMDAKTFIVKLSPKIHYHALVGAIPSTSMKKGEIFSIPKVEGWRLYNFLQNKYVVYEDGVLEFIEDQIAKRKFLGELKTLEDCEYEVDLGEYKLTGRQKVGAKFIEDAGSCILADPMGAGKSIQSLSPAIRNNERILILCPAQLVLNWMYEIRKYTGQSPYIMSGTEPKPFHYVDLLTNKKQYNIINYESIAKVIEMKDVTIDEHNIKHEKKIEKWLWIDLLRQSNFDRIIVDEAHYIKNMDSLRSQATRKLING